jgi:hypothetical protein
MAELNKTIHIRKGSTEQTVKLYTTAAEAGNAYSYIKVDGVRAYIPLGAENDGRATMGRVKEHTGNQFAILTSGKPPYHKDSYTTPGTYTWTCPAGVTTARVTVAGGGAGGCTTFLTIKFPGGSGALITTTVSVVPNSSYSVVVGAGSDGVFSGNIPNYPKNGGTSSALGIQAQGGKAYQGNNSPAQSYGDGGAGGANGKQAGSHGWVYIEYGGDI